jgi:hypothetical protein
MGNALMSQWEVEEVLRQQGRRMSTLAIPYRHLASLSSREKARDNREYLFIAWDDERLEGARK